MPPEEATRSTQSLGPPFDTIAFRDRLRMKRVVADPRRGRVEARGADERRWIMHHDMINPPSTLTVWPVI